MLSKLKEYLRIIKIAEKPSLEEFIEVVKVTGLGILLIGFTGIAIQLLFSLIRF